MRTRYRQIKVNGEWKLVEIDRIPEPSRGLTIIPDLPAYRSPIDGRAIDGRKQRREDLKRHGCVEYDPGMKQDTERRRQESERRLDDLLK